MFGKGFVLICLLMASIFASAVVHAREVPNLPTLECSGEIHTDADGDQSRGDSDNGMPHHHSCHGAAAFIPATTQGVYEIALSAAQPAILASAPPDRWSLGPALRPPIV